MGRVPLPPPTHFYPEQLYKFDSVDDLNATLRSRPGLEFVGFLGGYWIAKGHIRVEREKKN